MKTRWLVPTTALVIVGLVLAGCSGRQGDDEMTASDGSGGDDAAELAPGAAGEGPGDDADSSEATSASTGGLGPAPQGQPVSLGRSIIATVELAVVVDDVERASTRAIDAATSAGGFLAGQEARLADREVSITLRVPTERYEGALADLGDLGEVVERRVETDDVTEQVVDLEGRIASARVSVDRVRRLLEESGDVVQLATVEGELSRREADLESLLGQQRVLADQVDLATIRLELSEETPEPEPEPEPNDDPAGFLGGLRDGWDAFATAGATALTAVGFVFPFLVALALIAGLGLLLRGRTTRVRPAAE